MKMIILNTYNMICNIPKIFVNQYATDEMIVMKLQVAISNICFLIN